MFPTHSKMSLHFTKLLPHVFTKRKYIASTEFAYCPELLSTQFLVSLKDKETYRDCFDNRDQIWILSKKSCFTYICQKEQRIARVSWPLEWEITLT